MTNAFNDQTVAIGTVGGTPLQFALAFEGAERGQAGRRVYHLEQRPSQEGDPDQPFVMHFPFGYLGMGSSTNNEYPDTYDFGGMDARLRGRLYPRPHINSVTITSFGSDIIRTLFVTRQPNLTEVVYAAAGTGTRKVQISNDTEIAAVATGSGLAYGRAANWNGRWYLPRTAGTAFLELLVGDGAGTDTFTAATTGGTTEALSFTSAVLAGSTTPVLIRGTSTGSIATASTTPTNAANWSAVYPIASTTEYTNGLVSHDGNVFVSTTAGLFVVDPNVNGTPLTTHLANSSNTQAGRPCIEWHGKVFYPHHTGLYRTVNGLTRTVGIEVLPRYITSSTKPKGRVSAMAATAQWLYVAYYNGTSSFILAGREREPGEPGAGEMVWHSLAGTDNDALSGEIGAMCVYQGTDSALPRLYFGLGAALKYIILGKNGGIDPDDSGYTWYFHSGGIAALHNFAPNDLGRPNTLKVAETVELTPRGSLSSTRKFTLENDWDFSGVYNSLTANITSAGYQRVLFTKGTFDSGRILIMRLGFINSAAASSAGYLDNDEIIVRGRERPDQVREVQMVLDLTEKAAVPQGQTLLAQELQLRAWKEAGTALTFTDNMSGETFTCRMQEVVRDESESDVGAPPGYRVRVRLVEALN